VKVNGQWRLEWSKKDPPLTFSSSARRGGSASNKRIRPRAMRGPPGTCADWPRPRRGLPSRPV